MWGRDKSGGKDGNGERGNRKRGEGAEAEARGRGRGAVEGRKVGLRYSFPIVLLLLVLFLLLLVSFSSLVYIRRDHTLIGFVWSGEKEGISASALFPLCVNSSSVLSFFPVSRT